MSSRYDYDCRAMLDGGTEKTDLWKHRTLPTNCYGSSNIHDRSRLKYHQLEKWKKRVEYARRSYWTDVHYRRGPQPLPLPSPSFSPQALAAQLRRRLQEEKKCDNPSNSLFPYPLPPFLLSSPPLPTFLTSPSISYPHNFLCHEIYQK